MTKFPALDERHRRVVGISNEPDFAARGTTIDCGADWNAASRR